MKHTTHNAYAFLIASLIRLATSPNRNLVHRVALFVLNPA